MNGNKNNKNKPTLTNKEFYNLMIKYRLENYNERKKVLGLNQNEAEKVAYQVSQDFCTLASLTYMDKFFKTVYKAQEYVENYEDYPIPKDNVYKEIMEKSRQIYSTLLNTYSGINTTEGRIENELKYMKRYVDNEVCKYQVNGAMDAMKTLGVKKYQYICEDKHNSCSTCMGLHKQIFEVSEAIEGVNFPPMHPNCKCTIGSHIDDDNLQELQQGQENDNMSDEEEDEVTVGDFMRNKLGKRLPPFYMKNLIEKFYSNNRINIDGRNYKYNPNVSQNIAIVNDKILNEKKEDKILLDLMKKRDDSNSIVERKKINEKAYQLMMEYNALDKEFSVDFFQEYDYYKVGRDVTKEIYDIIDLYKEKYKDSSKTLWVLNIPLFYFLVKNSAELDLKNRARYKTNSTYIFEDEIVDADALGNFVYGYLGKVFGFSDNILFQGGGFAQTAAGTSYNEFKDYNYDDPKDQYRIYQGMKTYHENYIRLPIGGSIAINSNKSYII